MVEIQLNKGNIGGDLPKPLLILFAVCTTLLVAVHMMALLISTCILPNMEAIASLHTLRSAQLLFGEWQLVKKTKFTDTIHVFYALFWWFQLGLDLFYGVLVSLGFNDIKK